MINDPEHRNFGTRLSFTDLLSKSFPVFEEILNLGTVIKIKVKNKILKFQISPFMGQN